MGCFPRRRRPKPGGAGKGEAVEDARPLLAPAAVGDDSSEDESSDDESDSSDSTETATPDSLEEQQLAVLHGALIQLRHREIMRGWRVWCGMCRERLLLLRGVSFLRNAQLAAGMVTLRSHWEAAVAAHAHLERALLRFRNQELTRGWTHWHCTSQEISRQHDSMRTSVGHLLHREKSVAMHTWAEMASERSKLLQALQPGLCALLHRDLHRAWVSWAERCRECDLLACGMSLLRNAQLGRCWRSWRDTVADAFRMDSALRHLCNRDLSHSWIGWRDFAARRAARLELLDPVLRRLCSREITSAWNAWFEFAMAREDALSRLRACVATMSSRSLRQGWMSWLENSHVDGDAEMARSIGHLLHAETSRAWRVWAEMATERATMLQMLRRGVGAFANRQLFAAWSSWIEAAGLLRNWKRRKLRKEQKGRALGFLRNQNLAKGWLTWRAEHRSLTLMRRTVKRLRNRKLGRAYGSWVEMAVERARYLKTLRRGLSRLLNRQLAVSFTTWAARCPRVDKDGPMANTLRSVFGTGAAPALHWLGYAETPEEKMVRVLKRLRQRDLSRGWTQWAALLPGLFRLRRALGRLLHSQLARGWGSWVALAMARAKQLQLLAPCAIYMLNLELVRGLATWARACRRIRIMSRSAGHMRSQSVARGWRSWAHMVARRATAREKLFESGGRAVRFLLHQGVVRGWRGWMQMVADRRVKRRCLQHLLYRGLVRGFRGWLWMVKQRTAALQVLRHSVGKMLHRQLATGLYTWRRALETRKRTRQKNANLATRAAAYLVQCSIDDSRSAWLILQGRFATRWKARRAYEYALAHYIEPDMDPLKPAARYRPGAEFFDRVRVVDVKVAAHAIKPEKQPRTAGYRQEEERLRRERQLALAKAVQLKSRSKPRMRWV